MENKCRSGKKELKQIKYYEEDREIEERRTSYYCDVLGIKELL